MRIDRYKLTVEMMRRDWTQRDLAERAGLSRQTIMSVKGGKSCARETGEKIAAALEMPIEKLVEHAK